MKKFLEYTMPEEPANVLAPQLAESVVGSKPSVDFLQSFSKNYTEFNENVKKAEELLLQLESVEAQRQQNDEQIVKREELETILTTHLLIVNENIEHIKSDLATVNKNNLTKVTTIVDDVNSKTETILEYIGTELPKSKNKLYELDLTLNKKIDLLNIDINELTESTNGVYDQLEQFEESVNQKLSAVDTINEDVNSLAKASKTKFKEINKEIDLVKHSVDSNLKLSEAAQQEVVKQITDLHEELKQANTNLTEMAVKYDEVLSPALVEINEVRETLKSSDTTIQEYYSNLDKTKAELKQVINEVNTIFINEKYVELDRKVGKIEEIFDRLAGRETLVEEVKAEDVEVKPAGEMYSKAELDRIFTNKTFQQPNPAPVSPDFTAVTAKLKFLEQAIGRIAATGPGGGEVNLRWLDDIDRTTIADGKYLRYNATTKKFEFNSFTGTGSVALSDSPTFTGTVTANNLTVSGDLTVNGTTTTVNSVTLTVDDNNIELGSTLGANDTTAAGGGITLKGTTNKTISWSNLGWTSSEDFNLVTGKAYEINGASVLNSTTLGSGVTASSLTSLGTIATLNAGTITASADATINGVRVGRGPGNATTNTALGFEALLPASVNNSENVGIGYYALRNLGGAGVGSLSFTQVGGFNSLQYGIDAPGVEYEVNLTYVSGSTASNYGKIGLRFSQDSETSVIGIASFRIISRGTGYTSTSTVVRAKYQEYDGNDNLFTVFEYTAPVTALAYATSNTVLGTYAGLGIETGKNNICIGRNASPTTVYSDNEIVIGSALPGSNYSNNYSGSGNTTYIGYSTTTTTFLKGDQLWLLGSGSISDPYSATRGDLYAKDVYGTKFYGTFNGVAEIGSGYATITGRLYAGGEIRLDGSPTINHNFGGAQTTATITIGGSSANTTGNITIGQSVGTQTLNLATGVPAATKTKTVNIGTSATTAAGTTNINIGSTTGTSTTTLNGTVKVAATTVSSSTTTGALQVAGGVGIAGNLNVGGNVLLTGGSLTVRNTSIVNSLILGHDGDTIRIGGDEYVADGNAFALISGEVKLATGGQNAYIGTDDSEAYNASTTVFKGNIDFTGVKTLNLANSYVPAIIWGTPTIDLRNCINYSYNNLSGKPTAANEPYTTLTYAATVTPFANTNVRITCTGNLTINAPATAGVADGIMVRLWVVASGADRTVSLQNTIKIPRNSSFTSPQTIVSGDKARIAIQYDATRTVWELVSFVNGY